MIRRSSICSMKGAEAPTKGTEDRSRETDGKSCLDYIIIHIDKAREF